MYPRQAAFLKYLPSLKVLELSYTGAIRLGACYRQETDRYSTDELQLLTR